MNMDLSIDHVAWDNTEPIVVESTGRGGAVSRFGIPVAKGRQIRAREKSPSQGVYLGFERSWHVPSRLMPPGREVRPGDVIEEETGRRWTVLTVDYVRLKQRWQMGCVDLVLALDLRDEIAIERAAIGYDASGAPIKRWPPPEAVPLYRLPCRVQELSREVAEERGMRYAKPRYEATVARQVPLLDPAEDRVRWVDRGGVTRYLDVVNVRQSERIDELPVLELELRA